MATETQTGLEFTAFTRLTAIPFIHSSIEIANTTLLNNPYTRVPYTTAINLSTSAIKYTEPLQVRIAPYVEKADGYANRGLDVVEEKYPEAFKADTEEVANYVRDRKASVTEFATKALKDGHVKERAFTIAEGIDQRFAPIVDYFETAINTRLPDAAGPSSPDAKYQYQRAYALSRNLTGSLASYSAVQLKQLQEHNALVNRATETAQSFAGIASSSVQSALPRVRGLSDTLIAELQKIQQSSKDLSISLIQEKAQTIPPAVHELYTEAAEKLAPVIAQLRAIKDDPAPWSEKIPRIRQEVGETVAPLLDSLRTRVTELLARGKQAAPVEKDE